MNDIENKMAYLHYCWQLCRTKLFSDEDSNPVTMHIEREVQDFLKSRVDEVMNQKPAKKGKKGAKGKKKKDSLPDFGAFGPLNAFPVANTAKAASTAKPQQQRTIPSAAPKEFTGGSTEDGLTGIRYEIYNDETNVLKKVYKEKVDKTSGKRYYLGFDIVEGREIGDGNMYEKAANTAGSAYFRPFTQQNTEGRVVKPVTNAQFSAASQLHAVETLQALQRSNPLIATAINLAKQG